MADYVFNISKGDINEVAADGATLDLMLLKADAGQATNEDYDTVAALLGDANNTEADFTNYSRVALSNVTVTTDDTNDEKITDADDVTYLSAGGTTDNTVVSAIIYEDVDGTDSNAILAVHLDASFTTDGNDVTLKFNSGGFFAAQ